MPDFELAFLHKGCLRMAIIRGDDHRDAYEALQSIKENAVIGDEIVMVIPFDNSKGENSCQQT